jgi:phage shock protein PspC (stress-responsive transcriptional regulator)
MNMSEHKVSRPITKDRVNRKVSGVCAGLAKHFDVSVNVVRVGTVIATLMFPVPMVLGYGLAALLLTDR